MPSTLIRKAEYDPESRVLSVWFVASGKRYDYEAVPPETYAALRNAFAKGRSSTITSATIFGIAVLTTHNEASAA